MTLYFNTKLVNSTIHKDNPAIFYPVVMPKKYYYDESLQYEILKTVIKSYANLKFSKCVFNIEIENELHKEEIKSIIVEKAVAKLKKLDSLLKSKGYKHLIYISPTKKQVVEKASKDIVLENNWKLCCRNFD